MTLRSRLQQKLRDRDYRIAYADEHLSISIATQIRALREQRGLTQAQLADMIGTKQTGVSRLESVNYDGWSIAALRRVANALDLRLRVSFEAFGTLWHEVEHSDRPSLERPSFADDPEFRRSNGVLLSIGDTSVSFLADTLQDMSSVNSINTDMTFASIASANLGNQQHPPRMNRGVFPSTQSGLSAEGCMHPWRS